MKGKSTEQFIEEAKKIHGDKYDYSLVDYKNNRTKVKIICNKCGNIFEMQPLNHLNGQGCLEYCPTVKKTTEQFIEASKKIHGDKYDYSLVDYKNNRIKIKIICNKCGNIFEQKPNDHLNGSGCINCGIEETKKKLTKTTEQFIEEAKKIHGDKYDYSLVDYKNNRIKIKIICKCNNIFEQKPNDHLNGSGCPSCSSSKGENYIEKYLIENNIKFENQKTFPDLKDKGLLSYDFYIPSKNLLIEYNGEQHYKWNKYFQPTYHDFLVQKHHDWLKRNYAKKNGIVLLTIPFWENLVVKITNFFSTN